jgi:hypothetical protein
MAQIRNLTPLSGINDFETSQSDAGTDRESHPRLLFFRFPKSGLPDFVRLHLDEHVRCLTQFFRVTVIDSDCDYDEVCDRYMPDLVLFESGVYSGPRKITNTNTHQSVPKVGLLNSDAYCITRSVFLSDMEHWGVGVFFSISVSLPEYLPSAADRIFTWPNFADSGLFRDYGEPKFTPILLTGSRAVHYPWRNEVSNRLAENFPSMSLPHAGWFSRSATANMLHGEKYARLLSGAKLVPTCGSIAKELVRKHFEIPAAGACLITEDTPSVRAAGFVDMENCIFASVDDVVDKVASILDNDDQLRKITNAGHTLVELNHDISCRDQIRQWYDLESIRNGSERIVQDGPFDRLRLIPEGTAAGNSHVISLGRDRVLIAEARRRFGLGDRTSAETLYLMALNYHFMPEPIVGIARCRLAAGDPSGALEWLRRLTTTETHLHHALDPDPVEWALIVRALLCSGLPAHAYEASHEYPALSHHELDRMRWVVSRLGGGGDSIPALPSGPVRPSVHDEEATDLHFWLAELCAQLVSCGQADVARTLRTAPSEASVSNSRRRSAAQPRSSWLDISVSIRDHLHSSVAYRGSRRVKQVLRRAVDRDQTHYWHYLEDLGASCAAGIIAVVGLEAGHPVPAALVEGVSRNPASITLTWFGDPTPANRRSSRGPQPKAAVRIPISADHLPLLSSVRLLVAGPGVAPSAFASLLGDETEVVIIVDPRHPEMAAIHRLLVAREYQNPTEVSLDEEAVPYWVFRRRVESSRGAHGSR